ncbi:MAG TPA: hypothetical protein VF511_04845 [Chthoniobacterales bacterium]|jgi:hypothetical protein
MPRFKRVLPILASIAIALAISGCGGTDRRQPVNPAGTTSVPPFIVLRSNTSAGTVHFPRGLYSLESQDHHGYYYRAPVKVYQRSFSGRLPHDGGIFVSKRNQRKLRGYVVMPSGVTHVGNLSGADYEFRF